MGPVSVSCAVTVQAKLLSAHREGTKSAEKCQDVTGEA